ncbi:hypothetical protein CEXT_772741 [Caerostris extrusa]|uniref:Uncharacterized protein n=1 Tax=Caerostris extrusa TaxID=172846 RepID=A0AAV4UES6_CAEEX|nr:hypothetical protein CEXT_772741 [Caerostris extrusa]
MPQTGDVTPLKRSGNNFRPPASIGLDRKHQCMTCISRPSKYLSDNKEEKTKTFALSRVPQTGAAPPTRSRNNSRSTCIDSTRQEGSPLMPVAQQHTPWHTGGTFY